MIDFDYRRIIPLGLFSHFEDHLKMQALAAIDNIDDPVRFFLEKPVAQSGQIRRIVVIAAIRFLDDHGKRLSLAIGKPFQKDAFGIVRNRHQPFFFQLIDDIFEQEDYKKIRRAR